MFTTIAIRNAAGVDVVLHDGASRIGECHGLHGVPGPRKVTRPRPGGHGEINETKHSTSRQPVFNGWIVGTDAAALWNQYDAILTTLWGMIDTPRFLRWTRSNGTALQSAVKLGEAFDPVMKATDAGRVLAYQLTFDREDPRNYAQTPRTATGGSLSGGSSGWRFPTTFPVLFTQSGSGDTTVTNAGTIETPAIFTIVGQISNPQILDVASGRKITLIGDLGAGSTLTLDGFERTVLLDGTADRGNLIDFTTTDWATALIPPGGGTYRLLATSWDASARLDVTTRDAYA